MRVEDWPAAPACRGQGALFFPPPGGESHLAELARESAALALCESCPVRELCAEYAEHVRTLVHGSLAGGVWAGTRTRAARPRTRRTA